MKKRMLFLLLAAALALCTSALAASPAARHWRVSLERGSVRYQGSQAAPADTPAPLWQPSWLPEGWALDFADSRGGVWPDITLEYRSGEERLSFGCCAPSDYGFCRWMGFDAEKRAQKKVTSVQGCPADFWRVDQESALLWEDQQGNLFYLFHSGSLTQAELEKTGGSVREVTEALPDCRLGWIPRQDQPPDRAAAMPGYVRDIGGIPDFIRFEYAAQPLAVPERTPEEVTVRGLPARLWLGDPSAKGTAVISPVSGKTAELPTEETLSTLLWTDPETGVCFRIQGARLPAETMLRMAESVTPGKRQGSYA